MSDEKEWADPIVAEVRAVRDRLAKRFNYNIPAIFEDLRRKDEEYKAQGFEVVQLPIRRLPQKKTGTHE